MQPRSLSGSQWPGCPQDLPGPGQHKRALQAWGPGCLSSLMHRDTAMEVDREAHGRGRLQDRGRPQPGWDRAAPLAPSSKISSEARKLSQGCFTCTCPVG